MAKTLHTEVTHAGQPYVDDPVYARPKGNTIGRSIAHALGNPLPQRFVIGHERVKLNWKKPDGKGGLVPR